jgi:hypothetical protein
MIVIFMVPTIVFWLSGIRGDGIIVFFLGLLLIHFHKLVNRGRYRSWVYVIIGLAGITILRSVLILLLIPALVSWWITVRFTTPVWLTSALVYGSCVLLFFGSLVVSPKNNLPSFVANRQYEYFRLRGSTRFHLDSLQPTVSSFVKVLPQSVNNSFFRPYLWESKGLFQLGAALEVLVFLLLAFLYAFKKEKSFKEHFKSPLILFPFLFAITLYIFIGYTIPFPGAIIRYKIPAELLLSIVMASGINWKFLIKLN